ncbi:MAG: translation elongation factor 4 [Candidatus Marinimicrobia bacterium]|nr:translation elongation factor 4 [Candidatus Neomarinimicrobiota bacterium]
MSNNKENIRNFCIIAHIDHGKSTLADRFLEVTNTVEKRKMQAQYLDQMELERERGITIKMQPVRMVYSVQGKDYQLNLIDTPGHIDFSYEVSRSLKAVEGAVLLVDATQGVQAQTVGNLEMAKKLGLSVVPVINKIDSPNALVDETKKEIIEILGCEEEDILEVSAKTGENCENLLQEIINRVPSPREEHVEEKENGSFRALVFDFEYSLHQGIILYVRVVNGTINKNDLGFLYQANTNFSVSGVGFLNPGPQEVSSLKDGEIGYVITSVKESNIARVGDTLISKNSGLKPLEGYKQPVPVVWASVYPETQDEFPALKKSLERLRLSDSALSFEEEESGALGRGFRCGFLGMLHLEIVVERLKREFKLNLVVATPSVVYEVKNNKDETKKIYSPALFPEYFEIQTIMEPWAEAKIISSYDKIGEITQLVKKHDGIVGDMEEFGKNRILVKSQMPLREIMSNFFEEVKSATSGYASLDYEIIEDRQGDLVRLDILLNGEIVSAFSKIVKRSNMEREARAMTDKLKGILPRALFVIKIQAKALGRILSATSISALKKDVTGHLYGGDITRKMKLWQKQKKGKAKMKRLGKVNVPHDIFLKMIKE